MDWEKLHDANRVMIEKQAKFEYLKKLEAKFDECGTLPDFERIRIELKSERQLAKIELVDAETTVENLKSIG